MKIDIIGVSNLPFDNGLLKLKKSLIKYNIKHTIIKCNWEGFYTKIERAYNYCLTSDCDYILFVDAHDVIFRGNLDKIKNRLSLFKDCDCIFSTEKACWPDSSLSYLYPENKYHWKYLNSGSYLFKRDRFVNIVGNNYPEKTIDDQYYFTKLFLDKKMDCLLDYECILFQSIAHDSGESFDIVNGIFINKITSSTPIILHGNGKTDMTKYYEP